MGNFYPGSCVLVEAASTATDALLLKSWVNDAFFVNDGVATKPDAVGTNTCGTTVPQAAGGFSTCWNAM